jgi:hypothetical protein
MASRTFSTNFEAGQERWSFDEKCAQWPLPNSLKNLNLSQNIRRRQQLSLVAVLLTFTNILYDHTLTRRS